MENWKYLIETFAVLGGFKIIEYIINRKSAKRIENISAMSQEWGLHKDVYATHEEAIEKKTAKIEELYRKIGELNGSVLALTAENKELKLKDEMAKFQKCEVRGCEKRQPPNPDY